MLICISYYSLLFNKCVFETLQRVLGEDQGAVFARSATAGGQRFPVHWGGDCESTFEAMAETLRGGLSLACSGFAFWSHDIGGFEVCFCCPIPHVPIEADTAKGHPPEAIYCRWVAMGLFSSHVSLTVPFPNASTDRSPVQSRLHGSNSYRVPWNYGESAVKVTQRMVKAKLRLMPYIFAQVSHGLSFGFHWDGPRWARHGMRVWFLCSFWV